MSKELTTIKGRIEIPDADTKTSKYTDGELYITSFPGGKSEGQMVQLSFTLMEDHIQLTKQQVRDLIATLSEWLD